MRKQRQTHAVMICCATKNKPPGKSFGKKRFFREPEGILFRLFCMKGTRDIFTGCR
jgi:hypothetical protein